MKGKTADTVWSGTWVAQRLGVRLRGPEGADGDGDGGLTELLGLALRRNPKRAHLLVSQVLGKHVPQSPATVYAAGYGLGERVRELLGERAGSAVVLGYAETATGLGHCVADGLGAAPYLHSTRRPVAGVRPAGGFEEAHSHATSHLLLPEDPKLLAGDGPLVLVDDEFSTGNTVLNTIRDLHARHPRGHYVVVALVDMRSPADRDRLTAFAAELGARVDLVALASGTVTLPEGVLAKGQALVEEYEPRSQPTPAVPAAAAAPAAGGGAVPARPAGPEPAASAEAAGPSAVGDGAVPTRPAGPAGPEPAASAEAAGPSAAGDGAVPARTAGPAGPEPAASAEAAGPSAAGDGAVPARTAGPAGPEPASSAEAAGPSAGTADVARAPYARVALEWPAGVPDGGRHGFTPAHREDLEAALPALAGQLAAALGEGPGRVLVLGNEELMYVPLRLAAALEERGAAAEVRFSSTTRSPVLAVDDPGYAIRTRLVFPAHDTPADGPGDRYAYNVAGGGFDAVVAVVDSAGDTPELHTGLLAALAPHTGRVVLAVVPSYAPDGPATPARPAAARAAATASGNSAAPAPARPAAESADHAAGAALGAPAATAPAAAVPDRPAGTASGHPGGTVSGHPGGTVSGAPAATVPDHPVAAAADRPVADAPRMPETPHRQEPTMSEPRLPEPLRGPAFSSYAPEDVGWLLQDLSAVELEAPTEEREEAIQAGGAHYAESLPVEYQPSARYQELYQDALTTSAARVARAVGTVTETVLAERSPSPVLVSLARAGTPVGVLMRRWAAARHGLDLPHYAVSIVRGRGIDANALRWLAAHHDPADVVFVDGWTGKGAITRELREALSAFPDFNPEIVVLADPGACVETYGTREDFLIPSACLNSTVSGLVSRTVLRSDLVGPDDFHGAKFYRELAGADVSGAFVDAVAARFDEVADAVDAEVKELLAADRTPTWVGWAAVERISEEYGIHDVNLVKPGVGETTRVLLRRVPWKILAQRGAGSDLDHVRLLAGQRGVPVEEVDGLPYTCVGLIHPRFTRGATGADGKAVAAQ
ncbi:phosphoribosyltransferase [Streptomyces sp. NPDC096033]|uniref:phosphoribosyltransferase n=1 Tax=Streptomyces sp. NPDC096033 TaxID=3366071 RepID=UPI003811D3AA